MAGLVRGAGVTSWSVEQSQRDAFVLRLTDNLLSAAFHYSKDVGDASSRAKSIEARAYATAQVASTTTTGARPHVEGVRIYTREAAKLVQALLVEAGALGAAPSEAPAGDAQLLSLQSTDREFLTKERARELLAPLFAPEATHSKARAASSKTLNPAAGAHAHALARQVKLSTKSFGRDAAEVAAEAFKTLGARLKHADLSDVMAGRPEAEALEALGIMCAALTEANGVSLDSLDLSDNALGEKGVRAAGAALTGQPRLKALTLQNVGMSLHASVAVAELLAAAPAVEKLHFYNNMTGDEGAASLAGLVQRCAKLADFRLVSSRVSGAGAAALIAALGAHGALSALDLCDNGLGAEAAPALAATVRASPRLRTLLLNECSLLDKGVRVLAAALPAAPGLVRLELCCNEISPKSAPALAAALAALPELQHVRLAENELEDEGTAVVCAALAAAPAGAPALAELDLGANQLHSAGARAAARVATARKCAKLGLDDNAIGGSTVTAIRAALTAALGTDVLGSMENNDEDGDDDDEEAGEEIDLDFSKAKI